MPALKRVTASGYQDPPLALRSRARAAQRRAACWTGASGCVPYRCPHPASATTGDRLRRGHRSSTARSGTGGASLVRRQIVRRRRALDLATYEISSPRSLSHTGAGADFYHAAKQLTRSSCAAGARRNAPARRGLLKPRRGDHGPAGAVRRPADPHALDYFLKNRHRFAYTTMVGLGLPRGSGAVESAIRRVINLRIKGASIYWLPESVDAILLLRSF